LDESDTGTKYTLVVCEKPDAARRIAEAIGGADVETLRLDGVDVYRVRNQLHAFVICSALGHLYSVSDHFKDRGVFPVFDLDWTPTNFTNREDRQAAKRIKVISSLASNAGAFINACDFDVEGETIGHNILKYACSGKEHAALRAKFSTLTSDELASSISNAREGTGRGLADAGRTRHLVDFIWGINLSRVLSESLNADRYNRTLSIGRVQGPTLAFVVKREIETRTFVPTPFWTVTGVFEKNGARITIPYATRVLRKTQVDRIMEDCEGQEGRVTEIRKTHFKEPPPLPFNTGDMQREAYRVFGYSPSRTLQIAERLYLNALISYPRTNSRRIPPSIDYVAILRNLGKMSQYREYVDELLQGKLSPPQSDSDDPAHPAIHPTGEPIRRRLEFWESKLYDLIVRRFLASFSDFAIFEGISVSVSVNGHSFGVSGRRLLKSGWIKCYTYLRNRDIVAPKLDKDDLLKVLRIDSQEDFRSPASRFNQGSLLQKMEEEGIGTKSTRAETINTLIRRGYISGTNLMATDYGIAVSGIMESYSPQVVSPELTREVEKKLEAIESGKQGSSEVLEDTISLVFKIISSMRVHQTTMGRELSRSLIDSALAESVIGSCPVCGTGKLRIIRSATTRKRFVGCTNYFQGCKASAPLPQKGIILKRSVKTCDQCGWPIVYILNRRTPWKLCINTNCGSKRVKNDELQTLSKRS